MKKSIWQKKKNWSVIGGGLLLMMSVLLVGYAQAIELSSTEKY